MSARSLKKRCGWIGAAVLLTVLAGCGKSAAPAADEGDKKPDDVTVQTAVAQTRSMETTVIAVGTLSPGQGASARVASPVSGRLSAVNVREGDRVAAGQVIAVVDNRPQLSAARSAEAASAASDLMAKESVLAVRAAAADQENSVQSARLALQSATLDRDNGITQAQTTLLAAQTDLQKTRAGARPQEIAQADQAVRQAEAADERAVTERDRVQFLFDKGIDSRRQLDDARTALTVATSALESARQQAGLLKAGARAEDLRAAELRVQQAREGLAQARSSGEAKVAQAAALLRQARQSALQVAVKQQDALVQRQNALQKHADMASAQAAAAYAQIRAPFAGIVTRRALNPGDMADTTIPVVEIADARALNLIANLPADEGRAVRPGMAARVTIEGDGHAYGGSVLSVGQIEPQTNLLAVRLTVANPTGALKSGAFATAAIVLRSDPRAVVVPKQAILTKDGRSVVFTAGADNVAHLKEVKVGPEQNGLVQIVSGVASGERVVQLGQYELTDSMKIKEAASKEAEDAKPENAKADAP